MNVSRHTLDLAKLVCVVAGAILAVIAAIIALINILQSSTQQESARRLYRKALTTLGTEPWRDLSGAAIQLLFRVGRQFANSPRKLYGKPITSFAFLLWIPTTLAGPLLLARQEKFDLNIYSMIVFMAALSFIYARLVPDSSIQRGPALMGCAAMLYVSAGIGVLAWLRIIVATSMTNALLIAVFIVPVLWLPIYLISTGEILDVLAGKGSFQPFYWAKEGAYEMINGPSKPRLISPGVHNDNPQWIGLGLYVSSSVFLSLAAMAIGHSIDPTEAMPRTQQMLIVNVICDALTLLATTHFLQISQESNRRFGVLVALGLNLILAASLSVLSLWFGTTRSSNPVGWRQDLHVLVGRSPDGARRSFGAYFWTMHTAFIPVAVCLSVVLVAYWARALLGPARWIVGKGAEVEKPVQLTGILFTLGAATMGAISAIVQLWLFFAYRS